MENMDVAIGALGAALSTLLMTLMGLVVQGGAMLMMFSFYGIILLLVIAIAVAKYIITGYSHSKLAEKLGTDGAYAWIPVFQQGFTMHLIYQMTGKKRLVIFDKYVISNGGIAVMLWIFIHYFGISAIQLAAGQLAWVPVVGILMLTAGNLLLLIPLVAEGILEYAYVRDVLNMFSEDKNKNVILAVIIAVADVLIGGGLARAILFMFYLKKEPLSAAE
jgi:hypothetical protein